MLVPADLRGEKNKAVAVSIVRRSWKKPIHRKAIQTGHEGVSSVANQFRARSDIAFTRCGHFSTRHYHNNLEREFFI
jgi:hypothetical protein